MRTTRAIGVAAVMIGVLAAAGCSSGSGDNAASPTTGTHGIASGEPTPPQSSSSPAPTSPTSTTTTNSTEAGAPGVPKAARQHTKAGAKAFAAYYVTKLNDAGMHPSSTQLPALSSHGCETCSQWIGVGTKLRSAGEHYQSPVYAPPKFTNAIAYDSKITHLVSELVQTKKVDVISESGTVARTLDPSHLNVEFVVKWTLRGWIMDEVVGRA